MKKQLGKIKLPTSGKKSALGVALDEHLLSYVEATASPHGISITRFGEVQLESDSGDKKSRETELSRIFIKLHSRSKTKNLLVAIPDGSATFFEMNLPESDPFLLEKMVEREVKKALGDTRSFVLQTEILYREKNNTKVAVTMLPQEPIDEIKILAKASNFKLAYVGLATEIVAELIGADETSNIIISVKARETSITVLSKGALVLEEIVSTGTEIWADKIAEHFDIKYEEAEEALFFEGIPTTNKNNILDVLRADLRKLTDSAEKVFLYWHVDCRKEKECRVRQVTLAGLGSIVPGLASFLENSLQIETRTPEPFVGIKLENEVPEMTESESLRYLPALAVALRGLRK